MGASRSVVLARPDYRRRIWRAAPPAQLRTMPAARQRWAGCTDTCTGAAKDPRYDNPANWSEHRVPGDRRFCLHPPRIAGRGRPGAHRARDRSDYRRHPLSQWLIQRTGRVDLQRSATWAEPPSPTAGKPVSGPAMPARHGRLRLRSVAVRQVHTQQTPHLDRTTQERQTSHARSTCPRRRADPAALPAGCLGHPLPSLLPTRRLSRRPSVGTLGSLADRTITGRDRWCGADQAFLPGRSPRPRRIAAPRRPSRRRISPAMSPPPQPTLTVLLRLSSESKVKSRRREKAAGADNGRV